VSGLTIKSLLAPLLTRPRVAQAVKEAAGDPVSQLADLLDAPANRAGKYDPHRVTDTDGKQEYCAEYHEL